MPRAAEQNRAGDFLSAGCGQRVRRSARPFRASSSGGRFRVRRSQGFDARRLARWSSLRVLQSQARQWLRREVVQYPLSRLSQLSTEVQGREGPLVAWPANATSLVSMPAAWSADDSADSRPPRPAAMLQDEHLSDHYRPSPIPADGPTTYAAISTASTLYNRRRPALGLWHESMTAGAARARLRSSSDRHLILALESGNTRRRVLRRQRIVRLVPRLTTPRSIFGAVGSPLKRGAESIDAAELRNAAMSRAASREELR